MNATTLQPVATTELPAGTDPADLVDALVQTAFVTTAVLTRIGAEHDLSLTQLRVLGILRDRRLRMAVLAEFLGLEKSTLSGLVDRAEKRGLVTRGPNPTDGRAVDVFLSRRGKTLAERVYREVSDALLPRIDTLTATEQRRLLTLLTSVAGPDERVRRQRPGRFAHQPL